MRALGAVGALVALLGACGDSGPKTLDMTQATASIKSYVDTNYAVYPHASPKCPVTVTIAKGSTFTCTVAFGAATLHIKVTQEDDQGTKITFVPTDAVLNRTAVAKDVAKQVVAQFTGKLTVDCGPEDVAIVTPGEGFDCTGTDEIGETKTITVTVTDVAGHYTALVAQP